jgi:hypothetical protein
MPFDAARRHHAIGDHMPAGASGWQEHFDAARAAFETHNARYDLALLLAEAGP